MTASAGREVHRNCLSAAALGGAMARAEAEDARGENFGDLGEAAGDRRAFWRQRVRAFHAGLGSVVSFGLYSPLSKSVPTIPRRL